MKAKQLFNGGRKLWREKLVGFIHNKCRTLVKFDDFLSRKVCYPARRADNDVNGFVQTKDVVFETSTTGRDHDIDAKVLAQCLADLRCLQSKLSCGHKDQSLGLLLLRLNLL